jgi:hypothetical protein
MISTRSYPRVAFVALLFCFSPLCLGQIQSGNPDDAERRCVAKLKKIYELLGYDLHLSGGASGFPSNLEIIYLMTRKLDSLTCPSDKAPVVLDADDKLYTSYQIVNDPLKPSLSETPLSKIAVVAEINANHDGKRNILFWNGSIRTFDQAQYDRLKSDSFIDKTSE